MKLAPIALFVYNRPETLNLTLESLKKNASIKKTEVYIFSDGPKNSKEDKRKVLKVREHINTVRGFKKVLGVEPAKSLAKLSNKKKIFTFNNFFNKKISNIIKKKYGIPKIICIYNLLANIDDLDLFLKNRKHKIFGRIKSH